MYHLLYLDSALLLQNNSIMLFHYLMLFHQGRVIFIYFFTHDMNCIDKQHLEISKSLSFNEKNPLDSASWQFSDYADEVQFESSSVQPLFSVSCFMQHVLLHVFLSLVIAAADC